MSKSHLEKITCPNCKEVGKFEIWNSINVDVDPQTRSMVKDRTLFKYVCPNCKKDFNLEYNTLYHDCSNRFMIWCLSNDNEKDLGIDDEKIVYLDGYKLRIVKSKNELIEKINIFELGLDDMIVEALKHIVLSNLPKEQIDKAEEIYFWKKEEDALHYEIMMKDGHLNAGVSIDAYKMMEKDNKFEHPEKFVEVNVRNVMGYLKK